MNTSPARPAVFLDRDGTLNVQVIRDGKPYPPASVDQFRLFPGVAAAAGSCPMQDSRSSLSRTNPTSGEALRPKRLSLPSTPNSGDWFPRFPSSRPVSIRAAASHPDGANRSPACCSTPRTR